MKLKKRTDVKNSNIISIIMFAIMFIGLGFAAISATLGITSNAVIGKITFDVHFENLTVLEGSMEAKSPATINPDDNTKIDFGLHLTTPGQYYEFTTDIVNKGTLDAKINSIRVEGLTEEQEKYLKVSFKYALGARIKDNDLLRSGETSRIRVKVEFLRDITIDDLPSDEGTLDLSIVTDFVQNDGTGVARDKSEIEVNILGQDMIAYVDNVKSKYVSSLTGINFSTGGSDVNGKGLYLRAGTENDRYPVYYYRGEVDNNNVYFADRCWKIVRTTETGGTKLLYNGTPKPITSSVSKSEYININNDENYPYEYDDITNQWVSTNHSHSKTGTIEFNIKTPGKYYFDYFINCYEKYDKVAVYVDNKKISEWTDSISGNEYLGELSVSSVIKVTHTKSIFDKNDETVRFSIGIASGDVDCSNTGGNSLLGASKFNESGSSGAIASVGYKYNQLLSLSDKYKNLNYTYDSANDFFRPHNYSILAPSSYNYFYAKTYTYNNGTFTLGEDAALGGEWSTNYNELKNGYYTCLSATSKNCSNLYYTYDGTETKINYVKVPIPKTGSDGTYEYFDFTSIDTLTKLYRTITSYNYYFSKDYTYEEGKYKLSNPQKIGHWNDIYSSIKGQGWYTCLSTTESICTTLDYVIDADDKYAYFIPLKDGNNLQDQNVNMYFSSTYTKNDNGTYTLNDPVVIKRSNWIDSTNEIIGYYFCSNQTMTTCNNLKVVTYLSKDYYYYADNEVWRFSDDVIWDGKKYKLSNDQLSYSTSEIAKNPFVISKYHYTCFSDEDNCSDIYYQFGADYSPYWAFKYTLLSNGATNPYYEFYPEDNARNKNDSLIKRYIDINLFENNDGLKDYLDYLEDTPWCNERTLKDPKGLLPSGTGTGWNFKYNSYDNDLNLSCENYYDNFTISSKNGNGTLKYPVGLITYNEALLAGANRSSSYKSYLYGAKYWTLTPYSSDSSASLYTITSSSISNDTSSNDVGVRPAISLKSNVVASSGDGSSSKPYVIDNIKK